VNDISRLRARIEAWLALEARERGAAAAGLRTPASPSEIAACRERFADLADPRLDDVIADAQSATEPESPEARHLADLKAVRARFRVLHARRNLDARAIDLRSALTAPIDGEATPWVDLLVLRRQAGDRFRRATIDRALTRLAADHLAPLARERFLVTRGARAAEPAPPLAADAETFLAASEERTRALLGPLLERFASVSLADAEAHDLAPVRRAEIFDRHFPRRSELEVANAVIERGLGLELTAQGRIHLDLEARTGREPGVLAVAVRVPDEVHVIGRPAGGIGDAEALVAAMGRALAAAHTDRTLVTELRLLGDEAVSAAFASLFAGILHERAYGEARLGADRDLYFQRAEFLHLVLVREAAARLPLEHELRGAPAPPTAEPIEQRIPRALSAARGLPVAAPLAWLALDPDGGAAVRLRGLALAAALRHEVRSAFGEAWFESRRAGRYLRDVWSYGRRYDAAELAREVGAPELTLGLILDPTAKTTA
jgi:hypothetical protein